MTSRGTGRLRSRRRGTRSTPNAPDCVHSAALDAGVPLRDLQIAARHADPRTTTVYDNRRQNLDRHAAYVVVAFVTGG